MRPFRAAIQLVLALALACEGATDSTAEGGMPADAIRVERAEIVDRSGFEKPLVAATLMIPVGWKTEGGVVWQQNATGCGRTTPHIAWRASAPDGPGAIEILPEESWSGNNLQMPGMPQQVCPNVWLESAREYLKAWVENYRPGATIVEYRDRPDFVKALNDQIAQQPPLVMTGSETRQWAEGGQALIAYEQDGTAVHELIGIPVLFNLMRMQGVMPGEVRAFLTMTTLPGFSVRAKAGEVDTKVAEMLRKSALPNSEWQARMAQHNARISQIQRQGAMDRSRIIAQTGEEIRQMQQDSWEKQNASRDRMQRETIESIRGTETYNDPSTGGTIELDNSYQNAWQLQDGSFILTDDASFDPYAATGQDGTRLEVAP